MISIVFYMTCDTIKTANKGEFLMKKVNHKGFLIGGIIFFSIWMVFYVVIAVIFQNGGGQSTQKFLISHLNDLVAFVSFAKLTNTKEILITIGCYTVLFLDLLIALLWVYYSIKSKNGKKFAGFLLVWLFLLPTLEVVATFFPYSDATDFAYYTTYYGFITNPGMGVPVKILIFVLLGLALLSTFFGIAFGADGIVGYAKKTVRSEEAVLIAEERVTLESVIAEREREEARLEEIRAERAAAEEESLSSLCVKSGNVSNLADLIRQIVREELEKNDVGGPRIVQNFYGVSTKQQEQVEEQVEEVKEEPFAEETSTIAEVDEAASVEETVTEEVGKEKKQIIRIPFRQRMIDAEKEMKDNYNELKNELLSWGLKSRISSSGDSFRLHCKTYCKISIAGKSLKLYLALNPDEYQDSTLPIQNAGEKNIYQEIPLVFKVRSGLSMRRAKALIRDACEKDNLEQGIIKNDDWASKLVNEEEDEGDSSEE